MWVKYLKDKNITPYTYQSKQERAFREVIRHLHHSVEIDEVKSELLEKGFEVRNIINIKHKITKELLLLLFVDLEPNDDKLIYKVTYLENTKILVEPEKNRNISQYTRCQSFFHTKSYCLCLKCPEFHDTALSTNSSYIRGGRGGSTRSIFI